MPDQFDLEVAEIERQFEDGEIDRHEYCQAMRELERDYADTAREAAYEASQRELERW